MDEYVFNENPYYVSTFNSKEWYHYWQGKQPKTKLAIEEYLKNYGTINQILQSEACEKHNVAIGTLRTHFDALKKQGLIPKKRHARKDILANTQGGNEKKLMEKQKGKLRDIIRVEIKTLSHIQLYNLISFIECEKMKGDEKNGS